MARIDVVGGFLPPRRNTHLNTNHIDFLLHLLYQARKWKWFIINAGFCVCEGRVGPGLEGGGSSVHKFNALNYADVHVACGYICFVSHDSTVGV